jgi:hypothetical protein
MTQKSKDYSSKTPSLKQGILIAIIGLITAILAATLPWVLNTVNPTAIPPSSTTPAFPNLPTQVGIFGVYLASDPSGQVHSTSFTHSQPICLFFNLYDPSGSNMVKTVWSTVDVEGLQANAEIYRTENQVTTSSFATEVNNELWNIGKYKIELYLNGILDETIQFEIIS